MNMCVSIHDACYRRKRDPRDESTLLAKISEGMVALVIARPDNS
jgi:hypothetical protein